MFFCCFELIDDPPSLQYTALRKVQNDLRHQVNNFADLNVELFENNNKLAEQLTPLKETEEKLEAIAEKGGANANKLRGLVKENKTIIEEGSKLSHDDMVQQMMEAVLDSERSEDGEFSDREVRGLLIRLKGLPAIDVNEDRFRSAMEG